MSLTNDESTRIEEIRRLAPAGAALVEQKIRRLIPVETMFVSMVGRPSARTSRLVKRGADDGPDEMTMFSPIVRVDSERRLVYAQAYNPPWDPANGAVVSASDFVRHVDQHGTFMTAPDVEAMAHRFLAVSRAVDVNHDELKRDVVPVESFIARDGWAGWDPGAWVLACRVDDDAVWARILAPEAEDGLSGYSINILARSEVRTVKVQIENVKRSEETPPATTPEKVGLFRRMLAAIGLSNAEARDALVDGVTEESREQKPPTDFASAWTQAKVAEDLRNVYWTLRAVLENIQTDEAVSDKAAAAGKAWEQARATYLSVLAKASASSGSESRSAPALGDLSDLFALDAGLTIIERVGRKISAKRLEKIRAAAAALSAVLSEVDTADESGEEANDMKEEDVKRAISEAVQAAVAPLKAELDAAKAAAEKPAEESRAASEEMTPDAVKALVVDAVKSAVAPLKAELDAVRRAAPPAQVPVDEKRAKGDEKEPWYKGVF